MGRSGQCCTCLSEYLCGRCGGRLRARWERGAEALLWPDLIVVGGGVSRKSDKFLPLLKLKAEIVPAKLQNTAGIVGAAWLTYDRQIHPAPTTLASE